MPSVSMRFEGGEQLAKTLASLSPRVAGSVQRKALQKGADPIRDAAASGAPREPGAPDLANHIGIGSARVKAVAASVAVGPTHETRSDQADREFDEQALFQEFGTSRHAAQPFMRLAFIREAPRALPVILKELWTALVARGFSTRGSSSGGGLV